ncbi:hypothetical protein JCM10207_000116 [Rhodosporidiobolus poonsookiae]
MSSVATSNKTVYFVTGANRGIGFGLVKALSARPDVLIFATARNPSKAADLNALAEEKGNIEVLQLEAASEEDARVAAQLVREKAGRIDVLIANAGICEAYGVSSAQSPEVYRRHFEVNTIGPVVLFSALKELLFKSSSPKLVAVSTAGASLTLNVPLPMGPYFASKASLNFVIGKFAQEHKDNKLTAFVLSPGFVQTDMGAVGAKRFGLEEAPVKLEDSLAGILKLVDDSTLDSHSGRFFDYTGEGLPW